MIATVTTDPNGGYLFPNLPPGDYTVSIDPDSIPDGYIATGPTSIAVSVGGGDEILTIDLGLVPNGGDIPRTGSDPSTVLRIALMSALFGLGLFLFARRRREPIGVSSWPSPDPSSRVD